MMKVLTFSTLYPSGANPNHGIFVETRLRHLLQTGRIESRVIAPVPWFPVNSRIFSEYGRHARVPRRETHNGIELLHPRYPVIPKVGMSITPLTLALWSLSSIARLRRCGFEFDLIDAHYYYPDGVAAAMLARYFRKPLVITARGTDLNLIPRYFVPRKLIRWAAAQADHSITVSAALRDELERLGVDGKNVTVLRNGVDLERFTPIDRAAARRELGLEDGLTFASVGHLVDLKGHDIVIKALMRFPSATLLIVGDGVLKRELEQLTDNLGLRARVKFTGAVAQERLKYYLSAADAMILASSREGWPNVLLEAMACGTPVVATRVGGSPEVVGSAEAGVLVDQRTEAVADGLARLLTAYPSRAQTRRYAERFSWNDTTEGQLQLFNSILARRADLCAA